MQQPRINYATFTFLEETRSTAILINDKGTGFWAPARPMHLQRRFPKSLIHRIKCAWLVFTGKADVLKYVTSKKDHLKAGSILAITCLLISGCAGIHNAPADLQMINDQVQTQMAYDRHNDDWHPLGEHWARGCPATGDCEDFAICAIEKMREAGIIAPNELAVIELWDLNGNERGVHAFARFKRDGINWAIDPTSKGVFTTDHWNAQRDLYGICTQRHATDPVWYCGTKDGIAIR